MLSNFLVAITLASVACAVQVTFFEGKACHTNALYGSDMPQALPCYDISDYEPSQAVLIDALKPNQTVHFYSDTRCTEEIHRTAQDQCYEHNDGKLAAFQVVYDTPESDSAEVAHFTASSTKELVPFGIKMSNYKGMQNFVPPGTDLGFSNFFIGATAYAFAGAVTLASWGIGCYSAASGTALGVTGCILGPLATILSFVAGHFVREGVAAVRARYNTRLGQVNQVRDLIDATAWVSQKRAALEEANFEYLSTALGSPEAGGVHVGYMQRDLGDGMQSSPVFEVEGGEGVKYHVTAYHDEKTGGFVHNLDMADANELDKRVGPGYMNVRTSKGGLDFTYCPFHQSASKSTFQGSYSTMYNTAYRDLGCLFSADTLRSKTELLVDMYNGNSVIVAGVNIAPYTGSAHYVNKIAQCTTTQAHVDGSCHN